MQTVSLNFACSLLLLLPGFTREETDSQESEKGPKIPELETAESSDLSDHVRAHTHTHTHTQTRTHAHTQALRKYNVMDPDNECKALSRQLAAPGSDKGGVLGFEGGGVGGCVQEWTAGGGTRYVPTWSPGFQVPPDLAQQVRTRGPTSLL